MAWAWRYWWMSPWYLWPQEGPSKSNPAWMLTYTIISLSCYNCCNGSRSCSRPQKAQSHRRQLPVTMAATASLRTLQKTSKRSSRSTDQWPTLRLSALRSSPSSSLAISLQDQCKSCQWLDLLKRTPHFTSEEYTTKRACWEHCKGCWLCLIRTGLIVSKTCNDARSGSMISWKSFCMTNLLAFEQQFGLPQTGDRRLTLLLCCGLCAYFHLS